MSMEARRAVAALWWAVSGGIAFFALVGDNPDSWHHGFALGCAFWCLLLMAIDHTRKARMGERR